MGIHNYPVTSDGGTVDFIVHKEFKVAKLGNKPFRSDTHQEVFNFGDITFTLFKNDNGKCLARLSWFTDPYEHRTSQSFPMTFNVQQKLPDGSYSTVDSVTFQISVRCVHEQHEDTHRFSLGLFDDAHRVVMPGGHAVATGCP